MKTVENSILKPFVKWAGGKRNLLPIIKKYIPPTFGRYYEPFVGGGALLFDLKPTSATISDINPELINAYRVIKTEPYKLIELLSNMKNRHSRDYYYYIRDIFQPKNNVERAARFIYLNKTCFNGLWRVNKKGHFNVPMGKYKNPKILDRENILAIHHYLSTNDIQILNVDFEKAVEHAKAGDLVYFDPPYLPAHGSSDFTSYTKEGFGITEHKRLSEVFRRLANMGVFVILSNSDSPIVRELYKDFRIVEIETNRYISSRGKGRKGWKELLIVGF